jgi:replicative DNA helicase
LYGGVEKPVPYDRDAELAIVNLAAYSPEAYHTIEEAGFSPEFFLGEEAARCLAIIIRLVEAGRGQHPRLFEIVQAIKNEGEGQGGTLDNSLLAYFRQVSGETPGHAHLDRYLDQVVDAWKKRELIRMAREIAALAYDDDQPAEAIAVLVANETSRIEAATHPLAVSGREKLATDMIEYYDQAQHRPTGASWGANMLRLDGVTQGTHLGELTVIKALPGCGKSALAQQACYYRATRLGRPQLYVTIDDMSAPQVFNRFMQQETGLSSVALSRAQFGHRAGMIEEEIARLPDVPLYILADNKLTSAGLYRIVRSMLRSPDVPHLDVYLDYAGQLKDRGEVYEKTASISSNLMGIAHNTRDDKGQQAVSLTVIHSLSKSGTTFGANQIEYDAENIILIKNDRARNKDLGPEEKSGEAEIIIEKQRHRVGGFALKIYWDAPYTRFSDPITEHDREKYRGGLL